MKEWYNNLYDLRIDNDKTQKEIAKILGISQQYYSNYEKGKNEIPNHYLITICKYYKVSADKILGLDEYWTMDNGHKGGCRSLSPRHNP